MSARAKYGGAAATAAWARFTETCGRHRTEPTPVTPEKVCGFLLGECLRGVSSQTLAAKLGGLLRFLDDNNVVDRSDDALSAGARREYARCIQVLEKEFPGEVRRKRTFSDEDLRRIKLYLQPYLDKGGLFASGFWAQLLLACAVGSRHKNLRGRAFTWSQISTASLSDGSLTLVLDLPYRKMRRGLRDVQFDKVAVPRRDGADHDLDAVSAMEEYAVRCGVALGSSSSGDAVFPHRHKLSGLPSDPLLRDCSSHQARAEQLFVLEAAGFPEPKAYGLHSARRTAASRMLRLGVDGYTVMRICGWASVRSLATYDNRCTELAEEVMVAERRVKRKRATGRLFATRFGLRAGDPAAKGR